jgi:NAD(P)-dependent dehydrogenase (short-subunit alcohol dehydrogenase family)
VDDVTKIALITGANRGLGFETARALAQSGATVLIGSRDATRGEHAAKSLSDQGHEVATVPLDVTSESSVRAAASRVEKQYKRLDILINSAGILPEATASDIVRPLDAGIFKTTFETNLFGAVTVLQEFLPLLQKSDAGRIVNVSTTMGSLADQSDPSSPYYDVIVPAYQSSKAALNVVTIALSKLLKDTPIKVNSVCPGWVQTDLGGPENRANAPLTAEEAAQIVVKMALVPDGEPSGQFVDRDGPVAW